MKLNFSGRTALITGGSGGIGLSIVKKLIKNKIKVIILDINTPSKKILLNKYVEFIKTDLSDYKNLQLCLTELKKKYKKIEYVINAAGVLWFDKDVSLEKIEINTWDKVFSINLNSIVIVLQNILPQMKKNKFGSIVHISSIDALSGDNKPQDAYGSSKGGVHGLSLVMTDKLSNHGIRVHDILPGSVDTPMKNSQIEKTRDITGNQVEYKNIKKMLVEPEGIAKIIYFICSDEARLLKGSIRTE